MKIVITGGTGFIGRAIVERLANRGDEVVALVRDPDRSQHLRRDEVTLVASDLSDVDALTAHMKGADGAIHAAGTYRIGIKPSEHEQMWDSNVPATEQVLDSAVAGGVKRISYVSTNNIFGNTRGKLVDETYRRDTKLGFVSWYDETKFRADEAAKTRIKDGHRL